MESLEELFISKLNDLGRSVQLPNEYEALRISGVLRQLLFDASQPLVHVVNRTHRLKLKFRVTRPVARPAGLPEPLVDLPLHGIDPQTVPGSAAFDELSLQDFLAYPVMTISGQSISVHEFLEFVAHHYGGIHHNRALSDEQKLIAGAFGFVRGSLRITMEAIVRVVVRALVPLRDAVWSPPPSLPILGHHRSAPLEAISAGGSGLYLKIENREEISDGFSLYGMMQTFVAGNLKRQVIYEIGTPTALGPRFSLLCEAGELACVFRDDAGMEVRLVFPNQFESQPAVVGLELDLSARPATLRNSAYFLQPERVAEASVPLRGGVATHQTLGASLEGKDFCAVAFRELLLLRRALSAAERFALKEYLAKGAIGLPPLARPSDDPNAVR